MTSPIEPQNAPALHFSDRFNRRWIAVNTIGSGLSIGLPIIVGDIQSARDYVDHIAVAYVAFCLCTHTAQWLLLRRGMPMPIRWILLGAAACIISVLITLPLLALSPFLFLLILVTYPAIGTVLQWWLLRQFFRPASGWVLPSCLGIFLGAIAAISVGAIAATALQLSPGISTAMGSSVYGLVYGSVTVAGWRNLKQQKFIESSRLGRQLDVPPDTQPWRTTLLPTLITLTAFLGWFTFVLQTSEAVQARFTSGALSTVFLPLLLLVYAYLDIAVHEFGHFLFAKASGFDLQAMAIAQRILVRRDRGWKLVRSRTRFAGGFVMPISKSLNRLTPNSLVAMLAGGPIASFALFVSGASLLLFPSVIHSSFIAWAFSIGCGMSLGVAIVNTLPIKAGYSRTDGRRILDVRRGNRDGKRFSHCTRSTPACDRAFDPLISTPAL